MNHIFIAVLCSCCEKNLCVTILASQLEVIGSTSKALLCDRAGGVIIGGQVDPTIGPTCYAM